jgi:hypothetical protein
MIAPETLLILSQLIGKTIMPDEAKALFLELNRNDNSAPEIYAPQAVVGRLIEKLQMQYNALATPEEIAPVFSDILARDRHTGYYIHSALRHIYLDFALARASMRNQADRNFLILGDFLNLSNVNEAIGRTSTNDLMATICGIYVHAMIRAGVVNWLFHRSMGDEITFIIVDTDAERVMNGLHEAERETNEFVQSLGLDHLKHKKYPTQHGTGLVVAPLALTGEQDHRMLKLQLDEAVKQQKRQKRHRSWWRFALNKSGVDPDQFHNRVSEIRIDKALAKYKHYRNVAHLSNSDERSAGRNPLNPVQNLLIGRAIAWPRDDRIEYLRFHHNDSKIMLRADIYNLGGLNAVFGHDGADTVKAHLIHILYNTITSHYSEANEPKIFDCGGGIIDVVIDNIGKAHVQKLVETLQNNIHHQILSNSVSGYANAYGLSHSGSGSITLADLPHPKQENTGTGLVMATHDVESARSLPEIIERLDKITHRTKMHDFAYLWKDDDNNVFALRLNNPPEPVYIGMDRLDANLHYLPFTDALRQFVKQEDLPAIFEKPVGQIAEILFGTDMQAVLGFKKAIRLLQEKNISDNKIEAIDSYKKMDEKLLAEGLPPLSVVSTQNRPAFMQNERESFRTMSLAEKLEDLPRAITSLILQAQAVFRTLKIIQPHGHLPTTQAAQILEEEIARFKLPKLDPFNPGEQLTESLYALVRLIDFICAVLDREIPQSTRNALHGLTFETLHDLAIAFEDVSEELLAEKFHDYVRAHHTKNGERMNLLRDLEHDLPQLAQKLRKKQVLGDVEMKSLEKELTSLLEIIRLHTEQRQFVNKPAV